MPQAKQPSARKGKQNRVVLNRCRIDVATAKQFRCWQMHRVSQGILLDRLTAHALRSGFSPATDCF
jgi:hypothetical protein